MRSVRSQPGRRSSAPAWASRVLAYLSGPPRKADPFPELTPREREVLNLIAAGLPNATIGVRLSLAAKTVSNHTSAIFAKLQVASRSEAIVRARTVGLGNP